MRIIPANRARFRANPELMMLDDVEMALELSDLAATTIISEPTKAPSQPVQSADLLTELYSAASMIMDREECDALVREIEEARRTCHATHSAAA